MIYLNLEQGTPEWENARIGIPTASAYDNIITPKKLELSTQASKYRNQLLAEWLVGHPIDWGGQSEWMDRGTRMEPEARRYYELIRDADVRPGGFVLRDDRKTGGSPDGLIDDDGGCEIKCPALHTHIGYLIDPDSLVATYRGQTQGYMYLTDREWWDILSYNPELPPVIVRIQRDEKYIAALDRVLSTFIDELDAAKAKIAEHRKHYQPPPRVAREPYVEERLGPDTKAESYLEKMLERSIERERAEAPPAFGTGALPV